MAWDRNRPVPWKRLLGFVGIYSLIVFGLFAVINPERMLGSIPGLVFGATVAVGLMALLTKFGWQPTMLRSRAELAQARAEREAARAARKAGKATTDGAADAGPSSTPKEASASARAKPAPTRRTSTGATNHPRRTRATRKR